MDKDFIKSMTLLGFTVFVGSIFSYGSGLIDGHLLALIGLGEISLGFALYQSVPLRPFLKETSVKEIIDTLDKTWDDRLSIFTISWYEINAAINMYILFSASVIYHKEKPEIQENMTQKLNHIKRKLEEATCYEKALIQQELRKNYSQLRLPKELRDIFVENQITCGPPPAILDRSFNPIIASQSNSPTVAAASNVMLSSSVRHR